MAFFPSFPQLVGDVDCIPKDQQAESEKEEESGAPYPAGKRVFCFFLFGDLCSCEKCSVGFILGNAVFCI